MEKKRGEIKNFCTEIFQIYKSTDILTQECYCITKKINLKYCWFQSRKFIKFDIPSISVCEKSLKIFKHSFSFHFFVLLYFRIMRPVTTLIYHVEKSCFCIMLRLSRYKCNWLFQIFLKHISKFTKKMYSPYSKIRRETKDVVYRIAVLFGQPKFITKSQHFLL